MVLLGYMSLQPHIVEHEVSWCPGYTTAAVWRAAASRTASPDTQARRVLHTLLAMSHAALATVAARKGGSDVAFTMGGHSGHTLALFFLRLD